MRRVLVNQSGRFSMFFQLFMGIYIAWYVLNYSALHAQWGACCAAYCSGGKCGQCMVSNSCEHCDCNGSSPAYVMCICWDNMEEYSEDCRECQPL
jgi:hypothetical protein